MVKWVWQRLTEPPSLGCALPERPSDQPLWDGVDAHRVRPNGVLAHPRSTAGILSGSDFERQAMAPPTAAADPSCRSRALAVA
jgi:hypothetical protein